jgi:peptidoglycan/xylan/chitin deacetylase (PgdA/CDA1 family)
VSLALSVRAKGLGLFDRGLTVLSRFDISSRKMEAALDLYVDIMASADAQATLPVTATVLRRHAGVIRRLHERGVELAIHGLVHNDYAVMGADSQRRYIREAISIFHDADIPFSGFRGPYLRSNDETDVVLREEGFLYGCSRAVIFPVIDIDLKGRSTGSAFGRAVNLYTPSDARRVAVRPREMAGLVDVPVALPDDEILIDRFGLDASEQAAVWLAILRRTYEAGELFTLQLHPERIGMAADALRAVLSEARSRDPKIWIARVHDIATWWKRRLGFRLNVSQVGPLTYRVELEADDDASIRLRDVGQGRTRERCERPVAGRHLILESTVKPVVGISARTPETLRTFLAEEGFPFEVTECRSAYGAYLDIPSRVWDEADVLSAIDNEPGPLVRIGRWPNGAQSALAVTGDIDSITLGDFAWRIWETWR